MNNKRGISLIVLVITIIVIIILAATVVLNLSESNIIESAETAVELNNQKENESAFELYKANKYLENNGEFNSNKLILATDGDIIYDENGNGVEDIGEDTGDDISDIVPKSDIVESISGGRLNFLTASNYTEKDLEFDRSVETIIENDETKYKVLSYDFPSGIYEPGDIITATVKVEGVQAGDYILFLTLGHSKATSVIIETSNDFHLDVNEIKEVEISYEVPESYRIGFYSMFITLRESGQSNSTQYYVNQAIYLTPYTWEYFYADDFIKKDMETIGTIGSLASENIDFEYVYIEEENIDYSSTTITIPANSNTSGQIKSILYMTYGTYEANIIVPDSDALLSSLFLYGYENEEENNEIDIEILYRDDKWQLWTTIYNTAHEDYDPETAVEPGIVFQEKIDLAFDPSADYHDYTINFYANYVSFEVDGVEVSKWNETFEYCDMRLYSGTFYANWLSQEIATVEKEMHINWLKRYYED